MSSPEMAYVNLVLNPDTANIVGVPDCFPRRSSTFRATGNITLTSSTTNGHVLVNVYPQACLSTSTFLNVFSDGGTALDVTNYQATTTATGTTGTDVSTYYLFTRIVAFQVKLIYIGAEQTAAGEFTVALSNNSVIAGLNVAAAARDCDYRAIGRAESTFVINWIPQDDTDLNFRNVSDTFDADKSSNWGMMYLVGTGLPKATQVYTLEWTCVGEGILKPTVGDFIPREISPVCDLYKALMILKQAIINNPSLVAREKHLCLNTGFARGLGPSDMQGEPATPYISPPSFLQPSFNMNDWRELQKRSFAFGDSEGIGGMVQREIDRR